MILTFVPDAREVCTCGLEVREEIWCCPRCHVYRRGKLEYTSVSKVIRTLMPGTYDDVDPVVLEVARLRGKFVDDYFSEWLKDPSGVVPLSDIHEMIAWRFPRDGYKNSKDTANRIERLLEWWQKSGMVAKDVQRIVYSDSDGIAGTFDLGTDALIIDLKNVSSLQPGYMLQLGAYVSYCAGRDLAILHVTKDKIKLVLYDIDKCMDAWEAAAVWYKTLAVLRAGY